MGKAKKKPKNRGLNAVIVLASLACVAVISVAGYFLVSQYIEYSAGESSYGQLAKQVGSAESGNWSPADERQPDVLAPPGGWQQVDFQALARTNPDIAGWLTMPDSHINYPVVKGADNEYYLKRLFDGTKNSAGTLFFDARNAGGLLDANTIIYGHNMKNQTMFHALTLYKEQSYYDSHPRMYLLTPQGNYVLELFSGFITRVSDDTWQRTFQNEGSYADWIQRAKQKSSFKSSVQVTSQDRCITLSTCSYEYDDARYAVVAKLTRAD